LPPVAVVVPPVALLPLAVGAVRCHAARRRRRAARCPAAPCRCRAARRRRRPASLCRLSPFVFLGGQSEVLDLTKAQWRRP
jgi:hypothetical protein